MPRRTLALLAFLLAALLAVPATAEPQKSTREDLLARGFRPVRITAEMKADGAIGPLGAEAFDGPRECDGWNTPSGYWRLNHCASPYFYETVAEVQSHARLHVYQRDCLSCPWHDVGTDRLTIASWQLEAPQGTIFRWSSVSSTDGTGIEDFYAPAGGAPLGCGQYANSGNLDESFVSPSGTLANGPGGSAEIAASPTSNRC